ncbi:MAG: CXXX repeat peptide maturase [Bacteroidaceae bacterium]|nr:CXXX repeat peptide maturase [Bacteroidaceae bacterium]
MLQYLIILLDETSTSFCHYENANQERKLMPLDVLKEGVRFGMMENLMIQFVYPDYELPQAYQEVVESIDHSKIKPYGQEDADVLIVNGFQKVKADVPVVLRITKQELFVHQEEIAVMLGDVPRLNVVLTDVEAFAEADFETYKKVLAGLSSEVEKLYVDGKSPQLNLLTDRMMLSQMNNCGAGDTSITLAPNGKFYVCPAFYYENEADSIGDLEHGLGIKNKQLYKLEYAPICRHCDAWQCKRCVWLNCKTTLEVNTPSHEQCVVAHLERNASRELLRSIRQHGTFLPEREEIKEIDYLDPFDKRDTWQ